MSLPSRNIEDIDEHLPNERGASTLGCEAVLQITLATEVAGQLFDELLVDNPDFVRAIQRTSLEANLLDFAARKETSTEGATLRITQEYSPGSQGYGSLLVSASGVLSLRQSTLDESGDEYFSTTFEIQKDRLCEVARGMLSGMDALLGVADEHRRFESFLYQAALLNPGLRVIVDQAARSNRGHSLGLNRPTVVRAFRSPRRISRVQLRAEAGSEAHRIAELLQRAMR